MAPTLIIGEAIPLAFELGFEDPVLVLNVGNYVELMPVHPVRQTCEMRIPRLGCIHSGYSTPTTQR